MRPFIPSRIAEVIFALAMMVFGINHLRYASKMGGMIPDYMPGDGLIWVYVTGAAFILAAIAIFINRFKTLACYLLATMLIIFILAIHLKPAMDGNSMSLTNLLKDTCIAMGAILIGNRR